MTRYRWIWEFARWPDCLLDYQQDQETWAKFQTNNQRLAGALSLAGNGGGELATEEILASYQVEGIHLDRETLRRSITRAMNGTPRRPPAGREAAAVELASLARDQLSAPVTHEFLWELNALAHRAEPAWSQLNAEAGRYRSHAMDIGNRGGEVFYQAPPAADVPAMMETWLEAVNRPSPDPLAHAAVCHLWFEQIHPFGDGNGRIGRVLIERQLAAAVGGAIPFSFSDALATLPHRKAAYYRALEHHNRYTRARLEEGTNPEPWIQWFRGHLLDAQALSGERIAYALQRHLFNQRIEAAREELTHAQRDALELMTKYGLAGFNEGLSSSKFQSVSGLSRQTAARQLGDLVEQGLLVRTGERRWTRYQLALEDVRNPVTGELAARSRSAVEQQHGPNLRQI